MRKTDLIKFFLEYGFNISPDALEYVLNYISQEKISEEILKNNITRIPSEITVVNLTTMKTFLESFEESTLQSDEKIKDKSKITEVISVKNQLKPYKSEKNEATYKPVTKNLNDRRPSLNLTIQVDIPEKTTDKPETDSFRRLFQNRFHQLSNILIEHIGNSKTIFKRDLSINDVSNNRNGIIIGMVQDTRVLHTNKFVIQLEDLESEIISNCVMVQDSESFPEYRSILRDTVIGI
ncbi:MAG: hypothetical protein ACFE95_22530, partial [Candidatus Hodarchaeota archaeon]